MSHHFCLYPRSQVRVAVALSHLTNMRVVFSRNQPISYETSIGKTYRTWVGMTLKPSFKQLQYFVTLAETGHYRKAADRLAISQPSLSLQITNLEEALQVSLLERGRRGATLTPEGRSVLEKARGILNDVEALVDIGKPMTEGLHGTLRLATSPTLGPYLLPHVVRRLRSDCPDLRLVIRDGAPVDLLDELLAGHHDLILTQLPVSSTDVHVEPLIYEPLLLAVALDHPLAQRCEVQDADLSGATVLSLSNRFTLHEQVAALVREVGATLLQDYQGTSLDTLRQMTAMNMGVTFLPALYAHSEVPDTDPDVALIPYRKRRFKRTTGLVWRKSSGPAPAFAALADVLRDVARDQFKGLWRVGTGA